MTVVSGRSRASELFGWSLVVLSVGPLVLQLFFPRVLAMTGESAALPFFMVLAGGSAAIVCALLLVWSRAHRSRLGVSACLAFAVAVGLSEWVIGISGDPTAPGTIASAAPGLAFGLLVCLGAVLERRAPSRLDLPLLVVAAALVAACGGVASWRAPELASVSEGLVARPWQGAPLIALGVAAGLLGLLPREDPLRRALLLALVPIAAGDLRLLLFPLPLAALQPTFLLATLPVLVQTFVGLGDTASRLLVTSGELEKARRRLTAQTDEVERASRELTSRIDAERRAADSLALAEARLVSDRERAAADLRALLEALPDTVLVVGPDGKVLEGRAGNDEGAVPLPRTLAGTTLSKVLQGSAGRVLGPLVTRVLAGGEAGRAELESGGRAIEARVARCGESNAAVILRDITERKDAERFRSELIAVVSHELRTPLTSIRGGIGLLHGVYAKELPEEARSVVAIALRNTERLLRLLNDILDSERLESGQLPLSFQPHDLARLAGAAIESNRSFADEQGVTVELDTSAGTASDLEIDGDRISQVLLNLISNAVKLSPRGGRVVVRVRPVKDCVRVEVDDEGPGIPKELEPRIFQRFAQADSAGRSGSGLGLHISRAIVERHGGTIGFVARRPRGTTFHVELPMRPKTVSRSGT